VLLVGLRITLERIAYLEVNKIFEQDVKEIVLRQRNDNDSISLKNVDDIGVFLGALKINENKVASEDRFLRFNIDVTFRFINNSSFGIRLKKNRGSPDVFLTYTFMMIPIYLSASDSKNDLDVIFDKYKF